VDLIKRCIDIFYAVTMNLLIPGAGFIFIKKINTAIIFQFSLVSLIFCLCISRLVFDATILKLFFILAASVHIISCFILIFYFVSKPFIARARDYFKTFLFAALCFFCLLSSFILKDKIFGVHLYFVPSMSMSPALIPGDFILIDTWAYKQDKPKTNDIIIFTSEAHEGILVKRIQPWPEAVTKEGYYVLGDNRNDSVDSRRFGGIKLEQIRGKVKLVLISIEPNFYLRNQRTLIAPRPFED